MGEKKNHQIVLPHDVQGLHLQSGSIKQVGTIVTSSVGNTYCYLDFFAYDDEAYRLVCREASGAEGTLSVLDLGTFQAPS